MRQIFLEKFGIEHLNIKNIEIPDIREDEILVQMKAVSLNYVDLAIVEGRLIPDLKLPFVPVADGAGVVVKVGRKVHDYLPGDFVATIYIPPWQAGRYRSDFTSMEIRPGAGQVLGQLIEYKVFKAQEIISLPKGMSPAEGATLPIAGVTAWNALLYGRLQPGQSVLVHGTGGVSIFALQFAKLFGARVIITSSSEEKLELARKLGADDTINYGNVESVSQEVLRLTSQVGVDLVVETVGGENIQRSLESLKPEGHISVVGFLAGMTSNLNLVALNLKRATLTGVSVGSKQDFEDMLVAMSLNSLKPAIGARFPLERVQDAFAFLKEGTHFGKVIVEF